MSTAGMLDKWEITLDFIKDFILGNGQPPYGDDPKDTIFILEGVRYSRLLDKGCYDSKK